MQNELLSYGLDSSVVIRLLTNDTQEMTKTALQFLREARATGIAVYVSDLVVTECYFSLQHHYRVSKNDAIAQILNLFESRWVLPSPGSQVIGIMRDVLLSTKKPGFVDRLIHIQYQSDRKTLVTFEKASKRLPNTKLL
jgi:predicted nucleic-acid-binding protein